MNEELVVVRPLRFTDDVAAMRAFLQTVGLRPRIEAERGGWVDVVAGAGMVALHSAEISDTGGRPGETRLSFESADLDAVADRLRSAGYDDATIWDESYGRVLSVTDPLGDPIWVDGYDGDNYGFRLHDPERVPGLSVMPIRYTDPAGPMGGFLAALGLQAREEGASAHWWVFGGHTGLVALHTPSPDGPILPGRGAVQLTFETAEPLTEVERRLRDRGYAADVRPEISGEALYVRDPDDQEVVIHDPPLRS